MKIGRWFIWKCPVYSANLLIAVGGDFTPAAKKYLKLVREIRDIEEPHKTCKARFFQAAGFKNGVIWFRDTEPSSSIIAHEAFHATYAILSGSGITLSEHSEEAFAYYLESIVETIVRFVVNQ
jgi:hypothetical protein